MDYTQEVRIFLEQNSSIDNPKSIRAIAESLSIPETETGIAIHNLIRDKVVVSATKGSDEGLLYYWKK